jgi:arylsulfatase A
MHTRLTLSLTCLLVLMLPAVMAEARGEQAFSRPNIVFIMADDLGQGDPGCYNPESRIPTPSIDRLAREGMRLTDAHSPSAVCTPTRYGVLTGRYCWRSRLKSGVLWTGWDRALIEEGRPTVASFLRERGYRTGVVGKWHLGFNWESTDGSEIGVESHDATDYARPVTRGPNDVGFESSFIFPASLDMPPYCFLLDGRAVVAPTEHTPGSKHRRQGGGGFWRAGPIAPGFEMDGVLPELTRRAVGYIDEWGEGDEPFFLYVPLTSPHTPWVPSEPFRGRTEVGHYGDFVAETDWAVGEILGALDRHGLSDDTLVIVTSDNGSHWPEGDIERWGHDANNGWRGQKADIWEGGHRVPFVARWPGQVEAGSASDGLVCLTDLFATCAEIVGEPLPAGAAEDSVSMLSLLRGDRGEREVVVHHSVDGMFALRLADWKLIDGLGSGGFSRPKRVEPSEAGPTGQLYNLRSDPRETTNLWSERPEVVSELSALLVGIIAMDTNDRAQTTRTVRIAVCQTYCIDSDLEGNIRRVEHALGVAKDAGAQLACFPETALLGWVNPDAHEMADPIPGPTSDRLCALAREHGLMIHIGLAEKDGDTLRDSAILIDADGRILSNHRKINILTELMDPGYTPGTFDAIGVVDTPIGRVGTLICADTFMDEAIEAMAAKRPELLLVPYGWAAPREAWPKHGESLAAVVGSAAHRIGCPVVGTDVVGQISSGPWKGFTYGGQSVVADGTGRVMGVLRDRDAEVRIFEVEVGRVD